MTKRAITKERLQKNQMIYALRMLGVKRNMIVDLIGGSRTAVAESIAGFLEKQKSNSVDKEKYLDNRKYFKMNAQVVVSESEEIDADDFVEIFKEYGRSGVIWIEALDVQQVTKKAIGKWTVYTSYPLVNDSAGEEEIKSMEKVSANYLAFIYALRSLGISKLNISKIIGDAQFFKQVSGNYQKKFFPIFESVDKKSCYLLAKKALDRKNLSNNIVKLMGENRQGFIYIECFPMSFPEGARPYINAQPYISEWLVIYRDQDSDYFNSKINLIDDKSPIEIEAVKSDDINPEDA